ncbi:uncharacterized protein [Lepeophtheirus salmonis]|uniref:uncharacterized protein n=1 Tax=Lepeophtheirus salmonis TaxID=72036 RepID=UPI001AE563D1|nr:uncharacterized protein LOC121114663 [Lepeophtheirus salmonis]
MHIISRFKTLRRLLLPKCPYHNGFSFRCMHSDSYEWLNSEFCDHLDTLRRKWLNASCPVTLDHPIDQWISQTRRKCLVGEIRNDELDSLSKKLNEMDVSPEQLIEALELLSLWPNVIGTFPFVPNFEEYLIIKLRNILHKISLELCFLNKTNKQFQTDPPLANKLQMLSIGNLWSFIDKPGKWDSVHYQIALKLCHKDGGRIIRAFRNVSVHNYLKLLGLLSRISSPPSNLHYYFLVYKFYDLYDSLTIDQKIVTLVRLQLLNVTLYKDNELFKKLCSKIIDDLPLIIRTQNSFEVRSTFQFIRALVNLFPNKFKEINCLDQVKDEESLLYLCSDLLQFVNGHSINRACFATCKKNNILHSDIYPISNLITSKGVSLENKNELLRKVSTVMEKILLADHWFGLKKIVFVDVMLKLTMSNCIDPKLIELFLNSSFFFQSRGVPFKKYCYSNNKSIGIKIAIIDTYLQLFHNYSSPEKMKNFRSSLYIGTLSDRDGEFESLKFMKCRDNFIKIKNFVLEKLGDENLLRECKVLPHHEYTQIIWVTDKQTGRISKFPSGFDDYSNGDIKKPYSNELNWYALSFSLVNTLQPITVEIHGEKISPYVTCIKRLGYKVYFITLSENDDSVDPALSYVSALMKSFDR